MVGHILERDRTAVGHIENEIAAVSRITVERTVDELQSVVVVVILDEQIAAVVLNELGGFVIRNDGVTAAAAVDGRLKRTRHADEIIARAAAHREVVAVIGDEHSASVGHNQNIVGVIVDGIIARASVERHVRIPIEDRIIARARIDRDVRAVIIDVVVARASV